MKYLSTQSRLSTITIQDRQEVQFIVPAEVAMIVFWFLANPSAQLIGLIVWWLGYGLTIRYCRFCDYLTGWRSKTRLIQQGLIRLVADLLTIQVAHCFG